MINQKHVFIFFILNILLFTALNANTDTKKEKEDTKLYLLDGKCPNCGSTNISRYIYGGGSNYGRNAILFLYRHGYKGEIKMVGCRLRKDFEDMAPYHCLDCKAHIFTKEEEKSYVWLRRMVKEYRSHPKITK